jgi:hypothetical protein
VLKRLLWLTIGVGLGVSLSFWVARTIRQTLRRYTPERIRRDLNRGARTFGKNLRAAIAEGRVAMREREAEIRAELAQTSRFSR